VIEQGGWFLALANVAVSVVAGFAAVVAGILGTRALL
jgi:fluoride ion exporter CrcB/FEX